jgi:hypothetical protein
VPRTPEPLARSRLDQFGRKEDALLMVKQGDPRINGSQHRQPSQRSS